jgi:hypothetical protein
MPLATDFRPYFTIHDPEHGALAPKTPPRLGVVLGATNPLLARECAHWPHVLSLARCVRPLPALRRVEDLPPLTHMSRRPEKGAGMGTPTKAARTAMAGPPPGWTTRTHKRHISKDRALLATCEAALASGSEQARASPLFLSPPPFLSDTCIDGLG